MKIMKIFGTRTATLIPDEGEILKDALNQAIADVTTDSGIDTVSIDLPKGVEPLIYDTLISSGFKIRSWRPEGFTMIRVLRSL